MDSAAQYRFLAFSVLVLRLTANDVSAPLPPVENVVIEMAAADRVRQSYMSGYTSIRQYSIENTRFKTRATMKVRLTVTPGGAKNFRILEMSGPSAIRKMVFQRMLDTETQASTKEGREATRISANNYSFRQLDIQTEHGRACFVLEAEPKTANPLLFRGRVWVDAAEYAVVRIEGSPAQNPSFWVRKTQFVHEYAKVGSLWLPASNRSETDVRIFGHTVVRIDYLDYQLNEPPRAGGEVQPTR